MRYRVTHSTDKAARLIAREASTEAVGLAMSALKLGNGTVTIRDTSTGDVYEGETLRKLARETNCVLEVDWDSWELIERPSPLHAG